MVLFFDLDGPLLDVRARYWRLHRDLMSATGLPALPPRRYWARKRARVSEKAILTELRAQAGLAQYSRRRQELIESPQYLAYDRAWPWARPVLRRLSRRHALVLVTARTRRDQLVAQLEALRLENFFAEVLSEPAGTCVDQQKAALIADSLARHGESPAGHWVIGDTEADIGAGRLLGLPTVAVLSGIRNQRYLLQAAPTFLLPDVRGLLDLVGSAPRASCVRTVP